MKTHTNVDIYVACMSSTHNVCAKGFHVAIVSGIIETDDPVAEMAPALALFEGLILERFVHISNQFEPVEDGSKYNLFITKSLDPSSHFESVCEDVKSVYRRITGRELELKQRATPEEEQARMESRFNNAKEMAV